jgi:hypothetical protein
MLGFAVGIRDLLILSTQESLAVAQRGKLIDRKRTE